MNVGTKIALAALVLVGCADESSAIKGHEDMHPAPGAPVLYDSVADLSNGPYVFGDDGYLPSGKVAVFLEAVERINAAVGFEALRYEPGNYMATGLYVNEVPGSATRIAHAFRDGDTGSCYILAGREAVMMTVGSPHSTIDIDVAMHESLHCLGIGHDDNEESLMFPTRIRSKEQSMDEATKQLIKEMAK